MMAVAVDERYESQVQPDRVHGSLYLDKQVFEDELERIWYRTWVFIGHESEVPQPGDYCRKQLGLQPVILTRGEEGQVHVVLNRCAHLGNLICHEDRGNAKALRCPYHGWTYGLDGCNRGVPYVQGYGPGFDKESLSLGRPARVESYRGFVFASMSGEAPELLDHLGHAKAMIDQLCDLSPDGEIELSAGWLAHLTRANWKMDYENMMDGYHPRFVHRALISMNGGTIFEAGDSAPMRLRSLGNGHGELDLRKYYEEIDRELLWIGGGSREKLPRYVAALEQAYGPERAHQMLLVGPPHAIIFPNLYIGELFIQVLVPLAADRFVQYDTPILWKGADELNQRVFRQTGGSIGPAGMVLADDTAMWERNYRGLHAQQPEWLYRRRGTHRVEVESGGAASGRTTDDVAIMGFWEQYRKLMATP
jgi:fatty-acyl-CoA synthase